MKAIRSDNGREYLSDNFKQWLRVKGIQHQLTTPYTPQQNRMAERYNRTLMERVVTMLADAGLIKMYWGEAVMAANDVQNRTTQGGCSITLYEAFYGRRPNISHLRVFGCPAYVMVPREHRRKLDERSERGIFLGYAENAMAYRVSVGGALKISRDVFFDETARAPPPVGAAATPPARQMEVDVSPAVVSGEVGPTPAVDWHADTNAHSVRNGSSDDDAEESTVPASLRQAIEAARRLTEQSSTTRVDHSEATDDADDAASGEADQEAAAAVGAVPATAPSADHSGNPRYPARILCPPQRLGGGDATEDSGQGSGTALAAHSAGNPDKMTMARAKKEPDWPDFHRAHIKEVESLWRNGTWELATLPPGAAILPTQMLNERKRWAAGEVTRHKGRFVVCENWQLAGRDYTETWAPVASHTTLRTLLALVANEDMAMYQVDVETAFLNGPVEEELYVEQPRGYVRGDPPKVCRLRKALYGLKQAARARYDLLHRTLSDIGLKRSEADPCLYVQDHDEQLRLAVLVYVDDLLIVKVDEHETLHLKGKIPKSFASRDIREPTYFLGLHLARDREARTLTLSQQQHVKDLVIRHGQANAYRVLLPMAVWAPLRGEGMFLDGRDIKSYQELLGGLLYVAMCTRPDISFAVGKLARFSAAPTVEKRKAATTVLRYLKGTAHSGLTYGGGAKLRGYTDADFAGDLDTRRSTSGFAFLYHGAAVSWSSKV